MKPRCRWRIDEDYKLKPYTLKVYLIENRRVNGKVQQETVAFLGSISATWLDSFWYGIDEPQLSKIRRPDWQRRATRARLEFWNEAAKRMKGLANRLGPDAKRLRMAIHAQIPWPMEVERLNMEIADQESEAEMWNSMYRHTSHMIDRNNELMEAARKQNTELRKSATNEIRLAAASQKKANELKARRQA